MGKRKVVSVLHTESQFLRQPGGDLMPLGQVEVQRYAAELGGKLKL